MQPDRRRVAVAIVAGVGALALLLALTLGQTRAIFADSTTNPGNLFATGTVVLDDNRNGTAIFDIDGLLPGQTVVGDIEVVNGSAAPMGVRLYAAEFMQTPATSELADHLLLEIRLDDATGPVVFTGTMAAFAQAGDWSTGHWTGAGPPPTGAAAQDAEPEPGPLRALLEPLLGDEVEDPAFWALVDAADEQIVAGATTLRDAWASLRDDAAGAGVPEGVLQTVDGLVGYEPEPDPTETPTDPPSEEPLPADSGDRLEANGDPGSARMYWLEVSLDEAAAGAGVNPADEVSLTFVWEGRA